MEKFKKTVSRRVLAGSILLLIIIIINFVCKFVIDTEQETSDHIFSFGLGMMVGAEIVVIYLLAKYGRALRDEEKMKNLYIAETDERNILIRTKTGGLAIDIIMSVLVCAVPIAGIFNAVVFFTLMATLIFVALLKVVLKIYYKNKF